MIFSQESNVEHTSDTLQIRKENYNLRVGTNAYKLIRTAIDDKYQGFEIVGDLRLTKKIYLAAEIGNETVNIDEDRVKFTTKGNYIKLGADYNFYENWLDMENQIYVGARYAFSNFSQQLDEYKFYNSNPYYGTSPWIETNEKFEGLNAHWLEIVSGFKAELFHNLYAGVQISLHRKISEKTPDNFSNLHIPGFNRTYDGSFGVGFSYSISYSIPIYKKRK